MSSPNYVRSLFGSWKFLLGMAFLGAVLALLFSFITPLQYSSSMRLLVTQQNAGNLDPYTAMKATERMAGSLQQLAYSTTFFQETLNFAKGVDTEYFPMDEYKRREKWRKTIETSLESGTGIMTVTVYHTDRLQARLLVDAASREMAAQAQTYFGTSVKIQVIDTPLDSRWYVRPNFLSNAAFGAILGFMAGIIWLLGRVSRREL
jgi:uncharacterized protein involved in exopolysaccharide biosynthesis